MALATRPRLRAILVLTSIVALLAPSAVAQDPEFRAMWATRFEWPYPDEGICKSIIISLMQDLADANFNAVFFQVRGQADVLYPSPYEVWSPLIGGSDPGWDPLEFAIDTAHLLGLEFHAYINTHTCWQSYPATAQTLPDDPNHIFYAHCNLADPDAHDWLYYNEVEQPAQFGAGNYVWFAPGVPAYQAYIRQQVLYVVENYDVDGVHFDRIRTQGAGQPSRDPISLLRQFTPQSNPENLPLTEWTADQITRTVRDMYAAIMVVKPHVKVSAAVLYDFNASRVSQHQDSMAWAHDGAMDMLVPMMYFTGGADSTWDYLLQAWLYDLQGANTQLVAGHSSGQGPGSLIEQVSLTRQRGAAGNSIFSWSSFHYWNDYEATVYQNAAAVPPMPWKDTPATGIVYGYVTDPNGMPVVDAQIHMAGRSDVALSSADGFYSFLQVTPGSHTLTAAHPEYVWLTVPDVVVVAGETPRVDMAFTESAPPGDFNDNGVVDQGDFPMFLFCMRGPDSAFVVGHTCARGDADIDLDVDLMDLAAFQANMGG